MSKSTRQCLQPWESMNITAEGTVYACCVVNADMVIGNLAHNSLPEIISGDTATALKRKLLTGDIAALPCAECTNAPIGGTKEFHGKVAALLKNFDASSRR